MILQKYGNDSKNQPCKHRGVLRRIGYSKSTLQDILKDGNTSLHTALHIAEQLNIPLSALTGEVIPRENLTALSALLQSFGWLNSLTEEDQKVVADHIRAMEILQK